MRAMILAAGQGKRMQPFTNYLPKPLLPIAGQPMIAYHIKALASIGVQEIIINVCYMGSKIQQMLGNGTEYGVTIYYIEEEGLLNTGGGIKHALPLLGNEPFIVLSGDIYTDFPLQSLPRLPRGLAHLVMVDNPDFHPEGDFSLDKGMVRLNGETKLTYGNIAVIRPEFFTGAPSGSFPLSDLFRKHILSEKITGQYYQGIWHNIGTPKQLIEINEACHALG